MHSGRVIPDGYSGRTAKITVQGYGDRRPFIYYCTVLREDDHNLYVQMGKTELFFRKQHIASVEFLEKSKGELSKSDIMRQGKECKIVYQLGKFEKTQCAIGPFTETEDYVYVELDNGQKRMIPKDCILRMSYPGELGKKKADWTNNIHRRRKANDFSYSRWWSRENIEEVE